MKRFIVSALLSVVSLTALASTSNVTATITDPDGTVWGNCTWSATINSASPLTIAGVAVPDSQVRANGSCSATGVITATILDTSSVQQSGVTWDFTIQPNASVAPSVVPGVAVAGATVNISAALSAGIKAPRFGAGPNAYGYADLEINSSSIGNTYFNTGTVCSPTGGMRQLSNSGWQCGGGGGGGGGVTIPNTTALLKGNGTGGVLAGVAGTDYPTVASVTAAASAATAAQTTANAAMPKAGGAFTGPVTVAADPTAALGVATKQYVDAHPDSYPVTNVQALGAKGDGEIAWDGSMAAFIPAPVFGSSTTATTPAVTTNFANDVVVSIFFDFDQLMSAPSAGSIRFNNSGAGVNGAMIVDHTVAAAGLVPAVTATLAGSNVWYGATLPLVPRTGGTIAFVAASGNAGSIPAITVNKPTGATMGDLEVACLLSFSSGNSITSSPVQFHNNFAIPVTSSAFGGNHPIQCWEHVVAATEPATYAWTQSNSSAGWSVVIADYRNVGGTDNPITQTVWAASTACAFTQQIIDSNNNLQMCSTEGTTGTGTHPTWATTFGATTTDGSATWVMRGAAPVFTSADVGKLLCIDSSNAIGTSGGCGFVGNVISSTQILPLGFANTTTGAFVSREYKVASDDTVFFQTCINDAPVTCNIPRGNYGLSAPLIFKPNVPFIAIGVGRGIPTDFNAIGGKLAGSIDNTALGSSLWVMSNSLTTAALQFIATGADAQSDNIVSQQLQHISIIAGTGHELAGGGSDGIDLLNWNGLVIDDVAISNFAGNGIYIDASSMAGLTYSESDLITNSFIQWNGLNGVKYGSTTGDGFYLDANAITNTVIAANSLAGVAVNSGVRGFVISNTKVVDNNISDSANITEVYFQGEPVGISLISNYLESGCNGGQGNGPFNYTSSLAGNISGLGSNDISQICVPSQPPTLQFSAAGIPLPVLTTATTAQYNHLPPITVTDATTCTAGGTYTSGGTLECGVVSIGTTWHTTGAFQ